MALLMMGAVSFTACDEEEESDQPAKGNGIVYVLNEGSMGSNNASVSAINLKDTTAYASQFATVNGRNLGDTGQDMLRYGGKIYIAVYGSNTIEVVDGNSLKSIKTIQTEAGKPGNPRSLAADNGRFTSLFTTVMLPNLTQPSLLSRIQSRLVQTQRRSQSPTAIFTLQCLTV